MDGVPCIMIAVSKTVAGHTIAVCGGQTLITDMKFSSVTSSLFTSMNSIRKERHLPSQGRVNIASTHMSFDDINIVFFKCYQIYITL